MDYLLMSHKLIDYCILGDKLHLGAICILCPQIEGIEGELITTVQESREMFIMLLLSHDASSFD
jgi:hypothetical protein